ncbi:STAS domain-containing protein [Microcoleus sp. MON1_C5]|uniref:STAS domain-containing protein n=1 Tax=Microcoleus sp. MON1_C5 TaxID=2818828 RepID=UPI002FD3B37D
MDIAISKTAEITVVKLEGDVDASTALEVQEKVLTLAEPGSKILLDMTLVPYMSSAGLRMLLSLYRQVSAKEGKLVLVGVAEEIKDTMDVTGFLSFFTTCDTLDSGIVALKSA